MGSRARVWARGESAGGGWGGAAAGPAVGWVSDSERRTADGGMAWHGMAWHGHSIAFSILSHFSHPLFSITRRGIIDWI